MKKHKKLLLYARLKYLGSIIFLIIVGACSLPKNTNNRITTEPIVQGSNKLLYKPYARYWWFASEIQKKDIRYNLEWIKKNGFGGVEIAWVYPLNAMNKELNSDYIPRQDWLSHDWQKLVGFTVLYADSIGLACDLTMGTLWPFGDSYVSFEQASQQFGKEERQVIKKSWEHPKNGYVVDHLNPNHYLKYFNRIIDSFPQPKVNFPQSYFIDSWEVHTDKLWTDGFDFEFEQKYGYDIKPYMNDLYEHNNFDILYDYRKLVSEKVIKFYSDFDDVLNEIDVLSRGQCSGAPCDIISAYAQLDIPEGESMLYEPEFNSIPASAALLSRKKMVSSETFTCLYGWPRNYLREEQTADLKLVVDALFANGINRIVWHGKAHNPKHQDSTSFYATVHLGPEGALAEELPRFNEYISTVSQLLNSGRTYSDVAVYLPTEDAWIKGIMPKDKQFIWAKAYYEMRYIYFPDELAGHHPIWINEEFLNKAIWEKGKLRVGDAIFNSLYIDAKYLDISVLKRISELAIMGLPVTLRNPPIQAGTNKNIEWNFILEQLMKLPNVNSNFESQAEPLIDTDSEKPIYWARENEESLFIFFAHPKCRQIKFPMEYGQSYVEKVIELPITINYKSKSYEVNLSFAPYQSLLYEIRNGILKEIDITFLPKIPIVKPRPIDFKEPWLIKS